MTSADVVPAVAELTPATQDYLRAVYKLARRSPAGGRVTTSQLADWLGIRPASVTAMLQKLAAANPALVDYEKHQGVRLTTDGERAAVSLVRHHRLLELFLQEKLGYSWDEVHDEADRLEHGVSNVLAERLVAVLGNPTHDPHGHPIPGVDLTVVPPVGLPLDVLPAGATAVVISVRDEDPALLRYLDSAGLHPGAMLTVVENLTDNGAFRFRLDGGETRTLTAIALGKISVEALPAQDAAAGEFADPPASRV